MAAALVGKASIAVRRRPRQIGASSTPRSKHCFGGETRSCSRYELSRTSSTSSGNAAASSTSASTTAPSVSVILLAGGVGKRMGASMPKQFLELCGKPMALHSLQIFMDLPCVHQIVVVCDESYEYVFREYAATSSSPPPANADSEHVPPPLEFARPGRERQDSVRNGLRVVHDEADLVAVHDSARPLVTPREVLAVVDDASLHGAAVLGVRSKATVKEVRSETDSDGSGGETHMVVRTLDRSTLWEMHTPQVIRPALLRKGYELVDREGLEVTDDVSIVEQLGDAPVVVTPGEYTNIKLTTPDDIVVAERILAAREGAGVGVGSIAV